MKTILLHVHDDEGQEARLQAALDVTRAVEGHLVGVQASSLDSAIYADPFGGIYAVGALIESLNETVRAERERIGARLEHEGVSWSWSEFEGSAADVLIQRSRLTDLVVLSQEAAGRLTTASPLPILGDVATHAGAPVLSVPKDLRAFDCCGTALVAWNGSHEAALALKAALPLLKLAAAVEVVTIVEDMSGAFPMNEACRYLSRHGVDSRLTERTRAGASVAATLLGAARDLGAAYVVLGAYGHSRLRERILGGVTHEMLRDAQIPLLLAH